jgi:Outer membrane cobalamin receptor protein
VHRPVRVPLPLSLLAALLAGKAVAGDLFVDSLEVPEVLTATRLKQSPAEVPGSMTVLDRDLIKASGARDIPELMRLVPGMMVGYLSGNQATVNYHGTNVTEARRLQVLVDGRSVYRPGLATVDWSDIPVAIEDIDRIEVFRGPNAVSYGANALMGVINILTRHPADSQGTRLKYTTGQNGVRDWYASQGLHERSGDYRLTLSGQEDDGFDHDQFGRDYRDGRRLSRFNLVASHNLDLRNSLDWQLAAKEGTNQRPYDYEPIFGNIAAGDDNSDLTARDYAGSLRWTFDINPEHSLYVQGYAEHWERLQDFGACEAAVAFSPQLAQLWALDPKYVQSFADTLPRIPRGTAQEQALARQVVQQLAAGAYLPVCGQVNQNIRETRYDLEIQDTL